jgi:hypothetical protein
MDIWGGKSATLICMLMFLQKKELPEEVLFETDFSVLGDGK